MSLLDYQNVWSDRLSRPSLHLNFSRIDQDPHRQDALRSVGAKKGAKKVSGTVFWHSWPSLWASGDFQAQFLRGRSAPGFVSERGAAIDAAAECCEFGISLRRIDMFQPAG